MTHEGIVKPFFHFAPAFIFTLLPLTIAAGLGDSTGLTGTGGGVGLEGSGIVTASAETRSLTLIGELMLFLPEMLVPRTARRPFTPVTFHVP